MRRSSTALLSFGLGLGLAASSMLAFDAQNADKVDGKHAVGSGASINARKGKLVATRQATGRLPNNIISKAPDSAKLGGKPVAAYRAISLMPQGAVLGGAASMSTSGPTLPAAGSSNFVVGFTVPPDYPGGNKPLKANLVMREFSAGACSIRINASGLFGPDDNGITFNGGWFSPTPGVINVPAGDANTPQATLTWPGFNPPTQAGQFMQLNLARLGDDVADTCGAVTVSGILIRY